MISDDGAGCAALLLGRIIKLATSVDRGKSTNFQRGTRRLRYPVKRIRQSKIAGK
jgi:hypothetical protein